MDEQEQQFPISVSLALDALSEAAGAVLSLEHELTEAKVIRNRLIKDAASRVKASVLENITGLSREQLYRIKNSPLTPSKTGI